MKRSTTGTLFLYQAGKIATRLQGDASCSLLRADNVALVEHSASRGSNATVLCSDMKGSALGTQQAKTTHSHAYTPYGFCARLYSLHGFNGEYLDTVVGNYLLNSYRFYNTTLMRFHSPDDLSPFLKGGLNTYVFCVGDPINYSDPTGHNRKFIIQSKTNITTFKSKNAFQGERLVATIKEESRTVFNVFTDNTRTTTVPVLEMQYPKYLENRQFIESFSELNKTSLGKSILSQQHAKAVVKNLESGGESSRSYRTPSPLTLMLDAQYTNSHIVATAQSLVKKALDANDASVVIRAT